MLAGNCQQYAGAIGRAVEAPPGGGSFQATSAAVAAVHADAELAGQRFTARLSFTGTAVAWAAHGFASTEAHSAAELAALSRSAVEV